MTTSTVDDANFIPVVDAGVQKPTTSESDDAGFVVVDDGKEYVPMESTGPQSPKRSHLCCGCCCDTRRAVIVVNSISMTFAALAILSLSIATSDKYTAQLDDDAVKAALDEIDGVKLGLSIGFAAFGILCNASGVYGAVKFNKAFVAVAGLWYTAQMIRSLVFLDIGGVIMSGFFTYPHVVFYQELNSGVMSPQNYPQESQCCPCCV